MPNPDELAQLKANVKRYEQKVKELEGILAKPSADLLKELRFAQESPEKVRELDFMRRKLIEACRDYITVVEKRLGESQTRGNTGH